MHAQSIQFKDYILLQVDICLFPLTRGVTVNTVLHALVYASDKTLY